MNDYLDGSWNNAQLAELRKGWERKSYNSFVLYRSPFADELIVLVEREQWSLNRYFLVGSTWHLSMDVRDGDIGDCLRKNEEIAEERAKVPA